MFNINKYDELDIELLTTNSLLIDRVADNYYVIKAEIQTKMEDVVISYIMSTDVIKGYTIKVCMTMLNPYIAVAECISIDHNISVFSSTAIDLLEYKLQKVSSDIYQNIITIGDSNGTF